MSIDRSLKLGNALGRHRNVLKRGERIEKLMEEGVWAAGDNVTGLPKVRNAKASAGGKKKKKAEAE